jgi:DNA-directed RNA polymerase specialized sigma24 family protein
MPSRVFEETVLPHLDAAFNYARWLTRNDADAEDVVQDACVRVTRRAGGTQALDSTTDDPVDGALDPEARLLQQRDVARVRGALEQLPADFREVLILREIEGMSYKEIAAIVQVPIGTVMSRLARARDRLSAVLKPPSVPMERLS